MSSKDDNDSKKPRSGSTARLAAYGAIAIGLGIVVFAFTLFPRPDASPLALDLALLAVGSLEVGLGWLVLRRSRAGWSFLVSLNAVLLVCTFFGAPKIRDAATIDLGTALLPAFVFMVLTVLLSYGSDEF